MNAVVVVVTIIPVPEHRSEVIAALERAITRAHVEDEGCLLYALHEGDDRLVEIEKWSSPEALDAHLKGPAVGQLLKEIEGKIVGELDGQVLRPHPAGTPQQGAL
ncbi:antibiotic biosynthesis monooxygenase [Streptomyces scopuliridis]|uniref:Antibiotic biosynthesis monooxygenase n=1 Tax=Streptomyces scopuliridis TaxID=452529 RepID=A0ACD4ZCF7_9ACTN|nr:antibiotic biosynthesis monooxygenase [Streptomyces scopuliridis]WSB95920.1 antibiotic biosynthesis monooxygenase [Streptomyces scopuliridis]WSC10372.1 antibiotic biosynthesis monooxygenase [Streptomyces scopuliridis]